VEISKLAIFLREKNILAPHYIITLLYKDNYVAYSCLDTSDLQQQFCHENIMNFKLVIALIPYQNILLLAGKQKKLFFIHLSQNYLMHNELHQDFSSPSV
jgi:hypothetical protein